MAISSLLSDPKPGFVVHIPASAPDQIPVRGSVNTDLNKACVSALKKFIRLNGEKNHIPRLHAFVCIKIRGKKRIVGITSTDCLKIIKDQGGTTSLNKHSFRHNRGIFGQGRMPSFWFVGGEQRIRGSITPK